jgi:hypothetical protein
MVTMNSVAVSAPLSTAMSISRRRMLRVWLVQGPPGRVRLTSASPCAASAPAAASRRARQRARYPRRQRRCPTPCEH